MVSADALARVREVRAASGWVRLGVLASATDDGANLVIWDCNGNSDQNWIFQNDVPVSRGIPFGCWNIENQNAAPKVLGIIGASQSDGAQAVIWDNLSHPDQEFC
jgi:hypothetical protein